MNKKKDTRQLLRRLHRQGFSSRIAKTGHVRVTSPTGATVTIAATPRRGKRGSRNARADLRRIGAQL